MDAPKSSRQGRQTPVRAQAVNLPSVARANSSPSPQTTLNGDSDSLPLFVRGLPKEEAITARDLVHFFSRFGTVVRAKVQNRDGVHTGAATVDLIDVQRDFKNSILSDHVQFEVYKENPRVVFNIQRDRKRSGQHPNRHRPRFETDVLEMDRFTVGTLMNSNTFYECWECSQAISLEFEYSDWQSATVSFVRNGTTYQLVYKFKNIRNTFKVDKRTNGTQVTYHIVASLSLPPQVLYVAEDPFFWRAKGQERERIAFPYIAGQQLPLNAFFNDPEYEGPLVRAVPDTGRFMDHHYEVTYESAAGIAGVAERKFLDTMARLVHYGIITDRRIFAEIDFLKPADVPTPYNIQDAPIPYNVKFKLLNLLSNNIVSEFSIDDEFIALLNSAPHDIVEGALEKLTKHKQQIWNPSESLQMELADTAAIRDKILSRERLNYNQRLIRKIIITPTKIYYQGPQLELANRILRTYKDHADDFMRVAFADDDLGKINNGPNADMLFKRIQAIMDAGVIVAGRRFEFLHYSNSSMKTAGCWFICPFTEKGKKIDAEMICISIGDFSGISNPATLGARMAQCFSSTTVTGRLREFNVKNIDDIERNGHCFSDGVGLIGKNVAYNNCGELRKYMRVKPSTPSAFQFRMGGAKGVLTLDKRIPKDEVHLRKSQRKFPSTHLAFEVCRTSFYSPGFLNHQYVILLETLGIKQEVFLKLRDEAIQQLDEALQKPDEAIKALTETSDETNEIAQALIRMIQAGFFEINEPYLVNLLKLFRAIQLRDMKRRAKVHIRKGCNLLGVMDETGELPENKLFLQYTNPSTNKKEIVTGPVLVTRSPCLHPGDVQVVECVNLESLRHLVDVVVFSQHGQRPLPNMLAGGDLDGDTFFVSWDQRLLPKKTHEPMTYATGATGHPDKAMLAKVKEHFVNFLQQDNLGKIDNAWKAWADLSDDGARDPKAIRLAELHSDAVDFAKKGVPARMDPESKPKQWPDFMEKPESKNTYRSRKAVGAIYRSISVELQLVKEFKPRPELVVAGYEQYLEDAILNKKAYDNQIIALMNQYNVNSEFELVSGYMFKLDEAGIKKRPQELKEQVMQAVSTIQGHYRKLFFDDNILADPMMKPFKENILNRNERSGLVNDRLPLSEKVRRKASAWYMAAYDDRITTKVSTAGVSPAAPLPVTAVSDLPTQLDPAELQAAERRRATMVDREAAEYQDIDWDMNGRFYSFPWILHDLLCNIYVTATSQRQGTAGTAEYRAGAGNTGYVAEAMTAAREPTEVYLRPPGSDVFFQRVAG